MTKVPKVKRPIGHTILDHKLRESSTLCIRGGKVVEEGTKVAKEATTLIVPTAIASIPFHTTRQSPCLLSSVLKCIGTSPVDNRAAAASTQTQRTETQRRSELEMQWKKVSAFFLQRALWEYHHDSFLVKAQYQAPSGENICKQTKFQESTHLICQSKSVTTSQLSD